MDYEAGRLDFMIILKQPNYQSSYIDVNWHFSANKRASIYICVIFVCSVDRLKLHKCISATPSTIYFEIADLVFLIYRLIIAINIENKSIYRLKFSIYRLIIKNSTNLICYFADLLSQYINLLSQYINLLYRYINLVSWYIDLLSRLLGTEKLIFVSFADILSRYVDLLNRYIDLLTLYIDLQHVFGFHFPNCRENTSIYRDK